MHKVATHGCTSYSSYCKLHDVPRGWIDAKRQLKVNTGRDRYVERRSSTGCRAHIHPERFHGTLAFGFYGVQPL